MDFRVFAVEGLPEVQPGDDVASMVEPHVDLDPDDVVLVASTVVSKAEGRQADLADFPAGDRARAIAGRLSAIAEEEKDPRFAQAVLEESEELLLEAPILLAVTRFGHVTVNAGIDRSNVPDADILLLPTDPAASAERVRSGLSSDAGDAGEARAGDAGEARAGNGDDAPAVVVTDTSGRPFRRGQRGVAIGWAGIPAARDWRGEPDRTGRELGVTVQAVVDELAAAGNLATGEGAGGTPVAIVRGFEFGDLAGSEELFRDAEDDLVRRALREWEFGG